MKNENELKQSLISFVQEFGTQWNKVEREIDAKQETDKETDYFPILKELRYPLYEKYCTDKKRTYGGKDNCNSFGFPAKYNGIESPIAISAEFKTKKSGKSIVIKIANMVIQNGI